MFCFPKSRINENDGNQDLKTGKDSLSKEIRPHCGSRKLVHLQWKLRNKHSFPMFYTLIKYEFSTNQSAQGPICIIISDKGSLSQLYNLQAISTVFQIKIQKVNVHVPVFRNRICRYNVRIPWVAVRISFTGQEADL